MRTICEGSNDVGEWRRWWRIKRSCLSVKIAGIRRRLSSYQSDGRRYLRRRLDLLLSTSLSKSPHIQLLLLHQGFYPLTTPDNTVASSTRVLHNCGLINQPPAGETQHPRPAVDTRENPARALSAPSRKLINFISFVLNFSGLPPPPKLRSLLLFFGRIFFFFYFPRPFSPPQRLTLCLTTSITLRQGHPIYSYAYI